MLVVNSDLELTGEATSAAGLRLRAKNPGRRQGSEPGVRIRLQTVATIEAARLLVEHSPSIRSTVSAIAFCRAIRSAAVAQFPFTSADSNSRPSTFVTRLPVNFFCGIISPAPRRFTQ